MSSLRAILAHLGPLLCALLVGGLSLWRNRDGVRLLPDGWAMWEASVSLLERGTFTYLDGTPILHWPPLPAVVAAAVQAVLGVSARSLAWTLALVTLVGWWGWWRLTTRALVPAELPPSRRLALASAIGFLHAAVSVFASMLLLAHIFLLALLPWWLLVVLDGRDRRDQEGAGWPLVGVAGLGAALLLTHHTALVFFPWAAATLLAGRRGRPALRASVALLLPVVAWLAVRLLLAQTGSHPLHLGGRSGVVGNVLHLVAGVGELTWFAETEWARRLAGAVVLAAWTWTATRSPPSPQRDLARAGLIGVAGLLVLFSVIWVYDPLRNRFILFVAMLAAPAIAARLATHRVELAVVLLIAAAAPPLHSWSRASFPPPRYYARSHDWISSAPHDPRRDVGRITPLERPPDPGPHLDEVTAGR